MASLDPLARRNVAHIMTAGTSSSSTIKAGLTYLGQMVSHDIVPPTRPIANGRLVTPFLNLDSIYGRSVAPDTFEVKEVKSPQYWNTRDPVHAIVGHDVLRDRNGTALIPEQRNDENAIISQLHALWQRVHNYLRENYCISGLEAQKFTVKTFQLIIIEEFLLEILEPSIYKAYFVDNKKLMPTRPSAAIPTFFSHAAFRFGHSIVRSDYRLRELPVRNFTLSELFNSGKALPSDFVIDWRKFFGPKAQVGLKIDLAVTNVMRNVPEPRGTHFNMADVVSRNLQAGQSVGLLSGHEFIKWLQRYHCCDYCDLSPLTDYNSEFAQLGLVVKKVEDLPLWPYILMEAMDFGGENLGKLGSILVADVLKRAIASTDKSMSILLPNGEYDFNHVLDEMFKWGEKIRQSVNLDPQNTSRTPKFTMDKLISIIQQEAYNGEH